MKLTISQDEIRRQFNLPVGVAIEVEGSPSQESVYPRTLENAGSVFAEIAKAALRKSGSLYDAGSWGRKNVQYIPAIKALRTAVSGLGLAEAKEIVDKYIYNL